MSMEELSKHNEEDDLWKLRPWFVNILTQFVLEDSSGFQSIFDLAPEGRTSAFDPGNKLRMLDDFEEDQCALSEPK